MTGRDWVQWHDEYDIPQSNMARRLAVVQQRLREAFDEAAPGPIRLVSLCGGEGRDLFGALEGHPRRADVRARLVELDPLLAARARARADGAAVEVRQGDAGHTDAYVGAVPADIVLLCGIFGNISDGDIAHTIKAMTAFAAPGASVIWTRHRGEPDLVPAINNWFAQHGFELVWLSDKDVAYGVGVHRFTGVPQPLIDQRLFTFL